MAERGFVLSDRAVQYYLRYLDEMGFTNKVGNHGRVLTERGRSETDKALVDDRTGFIISKLERLAFRSTFDPRDHDRGRRLQPHGRARGAARRGPAARSTR